MTEQPTLPAGPDATGTSPFHRFVRVSQAGDRLMGIIATARTEQAWQGIADEFRTELGAAHAAFFLVPFPTPDERPLKSVSPESKLPEVPDAVATQLGAH